MCMHMFFSFSIKSIVFLHLILLFILNTEIWSPSFNIKPTLTKSSVCVCASFTLIKTTIGLKVCFCGCVFHFKCVFYLRQVQLPHTVSCSDRVLRGGGDKRTWIHTRTHTQLRVSAVWWSIKSDVTHKHTLHFICKHQDFQIVHKHTGASCVVDGNFPHLNVNWLLCYNKSICEIIINNVSVFWAV